jgi:hypothetical protein
MHSESNIKQILISKVITGIAIIYLLCIILGTVHRLTTKPISPYFNFDILVSILIRFIEFCIQVYLVIRLFNPIKPKKISTNFNRRFHPFFISNTQENVLMPYFGMFIFGNFIFLFVYLLTYFNFLELEIEKLEKLYFYHHCFIHTVIILVFVWRNTVLESYPVEFLKSNKLRIIEKYQDYINHKIADDEPHLTINQYFDVSLKSLPRNTYEKDSIEIKNPNAPMIPALVCKINDEDLAETLRSGYVLKAKLIEIKEEGNLEIELSLTEK